MTKAAKEKLTPESEACYGMGIAHFPSDWWDHDDKREGLHLKKEAPERAHRELAKWNKDCEEAAKKGYILG